MDSTQKFFQVSKLDGDNGIKYFRLSKTEPLFFRASADSAREKCSSSREAECWSSGGGGGSASWRRKKRRKHGQLPTNMKSFRQSCSALVLSETRQENTHRMLGESRAEQLSGQTKKKLSVSSSFEVYKSIWLKVVGCRFLRSRAWKRLQNFIYKCLSRGSEKLNLGSVSILVSSVQPTSSKTKVIFVRSVPKVQVQFVRGIWGILLSRAKVCVKVTAQSLWKMKISVSVTHWTVSKWKICMTRFQRISTPARLGQFLVMSRNNS